MRSSKDILNYRKDVESLLRSLAYVLKKSIIHRYIKPVFVDYTSGEGDVYIQIIPYFKDGE